MKCELFTVDKTGELFCSNPPRRREIVGTVEHPPPGLTEDQLFQVEVWKVFAPVAAAVSPIFSVTTYGPEHIEAEVRFRVPPTAEAVGEQLDHSLEDLKEDLKESGFHAVLDRTLLGGEPQMIVWLLALLADPKREDPLRLRRLGVHSGGS